MTSAKLRRFRRCLTELLERALPEVDSITRGNLSNRLERLMIYEAFRLVALEHAPECACQACIEELHLDVYRHLCEMKVTRDSASDAD